jgi:hypothetical protein
MYIEDTKKRKIDASSLVIGKDFVLVKPMGCVIDSNNRHTEIRQGEIVTLPAVGCSTPGLKEGTIVYFSTEYSAQHRIAEGHVIIPIDSIIAWEKSRK